MSFIPADIRIIGGQEFLVTWNDGHRSLYEFKKLRYLCPCAYCIDEWSGKRTNKIEDVDGDIQFTLAEPIGRYAFKFNWSDRHTTGIYGFDYLRQICPCPTCSGSKGAPA